jgi:hypothetical protein
VSHRQTNYAPKSGSATDIDVDDAQLGGIGHAHLVRVCSVCRDTPTFSATCEIDNPSLITANTA